MSYPGHLGEIQDGHHNGHQFTFASISRLLGVVGRWFLCQTICFPGWRIQIWSIELCTVENNKDGYQNGRQNGQNGRQITFSSISWLMEGIGRWFLCQTICFHGWRIQIWSIELCTVENKKDGYQNGRQNGHQITFSSISRLAEGIGRWFLCQTICFHGWRIQI